MNIKIKNQIILLVVIVVSITLVSCNESAVESQYDENHIYNGSFEENNQPTLKKWSFGNSQLVEVINHAAPNGGSWSLQLTSDWAPTTGYVYTQIKDVKDGEIVKLSASVGGYGKFPGEGIIILVQGSDINSTTRKIISSNDTVWTEISITDTLDLNNNNNLWVVLSSPNTEIIPFQQLFDNVKLEVISN